MLSLFSVWFERSNDAPTDRYSLSTAVLCVSSRVVLNCSANLITCSRGLTKTNRGRLSVSNPLPSLNLIITFLWVHATLQWHAQGKPGYKMMIKCFRIVWLYCTSYNNIFLFSLIFQGFGPRELVRKKIWFFFFLCHRTHPPSLPPAGENYFAPLWPLLNQEGTGGDQQAPTESSPAQSSLQVTVAGWQGCPLTFPRWDSASYWWSELKVFKVRLAPLLL